MRQRVQCIIIKDKKILLVNDIYADHYYPPGGKIDAGETHEESIIRELNEEIGVITNKIIFHSSYESNNIILNALQRDHNYIVEITGIPIASNEIREVVWVSWEEILNKKYKIPESLYEEVLVKLRSENLL